MVEGKTEKEKMDKDLLAALVYERSACWDSGMNAAIKVLEKTSKDSKSAFVARGILKKAGEHYMSHNVLDKAMECYHAMMGYCPLPEKTEEELEEEPFDIKSITELGAKKVSVSTEVNQDIYEILQALREVKGNEDKEDADLFREGIYQVILKYATDKGVRELLISKIEKVVKGSNP